MPPPITPDDWRRLGSLLDRVLDADPGQRAAILAEITGGDPARQAELQQLLEECDRGLPLLDLPAVERFSSLLDHAPVEFPSGLADRYELIRELGRGGMATVFLARDLKHARDVAVKIMRPELAASVGRERFLREIGIAAQLRHPNIVPLFDSGDADGVLYYVMPYEKGHSLRQRLARDRRLPVEEALMILRDVCDALACAHQGGIVHRDIKPDNVLLTGRRALVSDFGVARAVTAAVEDTLTTAGGAPGTPAYMAPERFQGGAHVDQRADIYALGVMAFEMLVGERPLGTDRTPSGNERGVGSVRGRVLSSRPDVPPALADVIARCLAARPEDRYRDTGEVLAALEALGASPRRRPVFLRRWAPWPVLAAALTLAAGVGGLLWVARPRSGGAPAAGAPRLAVLVFRHGTNPELEPLAMGLTDNLIGALGEVPGLVVRSLQAVMPYRDSLTPPDVLGRRLDVSWLVAGRLSLVGSQRTASVQLMEARTGRLIARTEAAAGAGQDVALIEAIVTRVATMLRERVGDEVRVQDWRAGTRSDAAFAAVYRAHQERRDANRLAALRDVPGAWLRLRRADATLDSASRADPRWPEPLMERARVALNTASMLFGSGHSVDSVPGVLARGISHARAALAMAPGAHRAGELLGLLLVDAAKRNPDSAAGWLAEGESMLRAVSAADTTLVEALSVLSKMHYTRGEYEQAYVLAERAYRADAFHADPQVVLSGLFTYGFEAEEDAEASRWCAQYGARFPEDWYGGYCRLTLMMWAAIEPPHADTALAVAARATAAAPRVIRQSVGAQLQTLAAGVLARAGAPGEARRVLAEVAAALAADPQAGREPFGSELLEIRVGVRLRLGERDSAAVLLRQLVRLHPEQAGRYARSRRFRGVPLDSLPTAPRT